MSALPSARRVLIVDDERDIRTTRHAVFASAGYECRTPPTFLALPLEVLEEARARSLNRPPA